MCSSGSVGTRAENIISQLLASLDHSWNLSAHLDLRNSLVLRRPGSAKCLLGEISVCCFSVTDGSQQVNLGL